MRHRWLLLVVVLAVLLIVWGYNRAQKIRWVGYTDLQVEFAVTDAATGDPIPGARIEVRSEGGLYAEDDPQDFALITDTGGVARKVCPNSMWMGTTDCLRRTDTYVIHLPWWKFRCVATGYTPSEWVELDVPQYISQAWRDGPGKAKLVVPMQLHKTPVAPRAP